MKGGTTPMTPRSLMLSLLFVLGVVPIAHAQTVTRSLGWTQPNDVLSAVNAYTFSLTVDAGPVAPVTPVCQTAGVNVTCTAPITLAPGHHIIVLTATNASVSASGTLDYMPPPTTPVNIQITIKITVP